MLVSLAGIVKIGAKSVCSVRSSLPGQVTQYIGPFKMALTLRKMSMTRFPKVFFMRIATSFNSF